MDNLRCLLMDDTKSAAEGGEGGCCCENFIKTLPSLASSRHRQRKWRGGRDAAKGEAERRGRANSPTTAFLCPADPP